MDDEQPLTQQDDIQLQTLPAAYSQNSYDRVPSYTYEGSFSHPHDIYDDNSDITDIRTTVTDDLPLKNAPNAKFRRGSQFSSSEAPRGDERRQQRFFSIWWLETSACITSVAALLALYAILWHYKNKPSPNWPNWISLNTILAILATILKTAILLVVAQGLGQLKWSYFAAGDAKPLQDLVRYDDASRGPVGSMRLLWRLRFSEILSSLAAIITILAVATDPFAQQILRYYDCSVPMSSTSASLPRTNFFSQSRDVVDGLGWAIEPEVQIAVNAGLFYPDLAPPVSCASGNCTWFSEYSTVGWCSNCEDISSQVTVMNKTSAPKPGPTSNSSIQTVLIPGPNSGPSFYANNLTTSLPGGGLSTTCPYNVFGGTGVEFKTEQVAAMGASPDGKGIDFLLGKTLLGSVNPSTLAPWSDCNTTVANETLWKCRGYGAARCSLVPCVKTFNASVVAGKLTETLLNTSTNWGTPITPYAPVVTGKLNITISTRYNTSYMVDTECLNANERAMLSEQGYEIDSTQRWLGYNMTFNWAGLGPVTNLSNNTFPESMAIRSCIYGSDEIFRVGMSSYLNTTFSGLVTSGEPGIGQFLGSQQLTTIYNYGNVNFDSVALTFENISTTITSYMRQNGVMYYSVPATGIATQRRTCVAIRWAWVTFPAALVALTLLFFVLLVLETWPTQTSGGRNNPGIFKTNPLPLLHHGLWYSERTARNPFDSSADTTDLKTMKELARNTTVKFNSSLDRNMARLEVQDEHDT